MDRNILSSLGRWCAWVGSFRAFRKVQHFVDDSKQAISPPQKGKKQSRNIPAWNRDPRDGFPSEGSASPGFGAVNRPARKPNRKSRPLRLFAIGGERCYMIRDLLTRRSHRLTKWGANASTITRQSSRRWESPR